MMSISRREFVSGASAAAIVLGIPERSEAWMPQGSTLDDLNNSRATINAPSAFLNIAKGFGTSIDPNNSSLDGYPLTTPANALSNTGSFPARYYDQTVWKFDGQGSQQAQGAMVVTSAVSNEGRSCIIELLGVTPTALAPVQVCGNITVRGQTNPRVVFIWGWLIQSIRRSTVSNGAGGFLIRINLTANAFGSSGVANGILVNITGANVNTGANAEWKISQVDGTSFDLVGSTFTIAQASVGGMAAYAPAQPGFQFYGAGPYGAGATQMRNFVLCKLADETDINNGKIVDATLIAQLQELYNTGGRGNPGWIRFMDMIGTQTNFEGDFSQRMRATSVSYAVNRFPLGYWAGNISGGAGDNYICSDTGSVAPLSQGVSVWDGANSRYFDNAIVQGNIDLNNIGLNPTLNVGGHGAKSIYNFNITTRTMKLSGKLPSAGGQTISVSFQASWLNSGTAVQVDYITSSGVTFTGNTTGTSTSMTVTGLTGNLYPGNFLEAPSQAFGAVYIVSQTSGTPNGNGVYVTNLVQNLSNATITTRNDTASFPSLYANLNVAMSVNSLIKASGIHFGGATTINARTSRAGALTVSLVAAPAGLNATFGVLQPLSISSDPFYANSLRIAMAGTIVTGDVLQFAFTRTDLPGGSRVISYTTNTTTNGPGGVPDNSLPNLVTNLMAQINADGYLQGTGIQTTTASQNGSLPANTFDMIQQPTGSANPAVFTGSISGTTLTVSAMTGGKIAVGAYIDNNTNIKLYTQITSQTSGTPGGIGVYVVSVSQTVASSLCWTTTPTDGNNYDSWTGGGLSMTFSKTGTGTATATIGSAGGYKASFIYNYLLDGWLLRGSTGIIQSQPYEVMAEMCNRVGAHCWFNWGTHKAQYVTDVTNFFATNLDAGLKFGTEPGNEIWNFSASGPFGQWDAFGSALNFPPGNEGIVSYGALRLMQYTSLAKAAWTGAGRSLSDFLVFQPSFDLAAGGSFDQYQLQGLALTTSNTVYANYGALGGGSTATSYTAVGSRPVDTTHALGWAPYWSSPWFGFRGITSINGTVLQNAPWLQASKDHSLGNTATAFASLANQFNGTTVRVGGVVEGIMIGVDNHYAQGSNLDADLISHEALAAQYDSYRIGAGLPKLGIFHYEGAPQWDPATTANSITPVTSTVIANLANTMSGLGWDVSAYTVSGTNNATEAATQVINMCIAWKHDDTYKNLIKTYYYQHLVNISGSHREVHPAHYGYDNSLWGLFETSFSANVRFKSYDAIVEWNA